MLFNRAECYRRIGEDEKAVADYRAFLEAVPAAPNRAQIEAKIATLTATPTAPPDVKPSPVAGAAPARPNGRGPERPTAPPPARPIATAVSVSVGRTAAARSTIRRSPLRPRRRPR